MSDGRFLTLHALRVKGMTSPHTAAAIVSLPADEIEGRLADLAGEGLARHRTGGRVEGWSLTKDGRAAHAALLAEHVDDAERAALGAAYEAFVAVNGEFKRVCHAWQTAAGGDSPNDHTDDAHDDAVIAQLAEVDRSVGPLLDDVAGRVDRMAGYRPRLSGALDRVRGGDASAFAAPLRDSYHDIWMELHEDLIISLGRTRDAADEG